MTAGNEGNEDLANDALLPDDGLGELGLQLRGNLGDPVEIAFARHADLRLLLADVHWERVYLSPLAGPPADPPSPAAIV